ncbi:hypothetical protein C0J52_19771 [Blattella germanica]|nr:hypothetical protein C0J52_19771 [Blattella germanica]
MEEGENGRNGEGITVDKSQSKEDAVGDEEGKCSLPKDGIVDAVQDPVSIPQETNEDDSMKHTVASDITTSQSEEGTSEREQGTREVKETTTSKESTQNMKDIGEMNGTDSAQNTSKAQIATEEKIKEKRGNLQERSSETGNESMEIDQPSTVPSTSQEQGKRKAISSRQGKGNINKPYKNSQSSSTESVTEIPPNKKQAAETDKKTHLPNKAEYGGKKSVEKGTRRTTSGEGKSPIKQRLESSGSDKCQNLPRKSMSPKVQSTSKSKDDEKDTSRVTQEKKSEKASTSNTTIRSSSPKTDVKVKTMKSTLRAEIDNKPTKSKSMELNKTERDASEKISQKQLKGSTSSALSPSNRVRSPGRNLLETSKQKSASTGTLTKNMDSQQKLQETQTSATQEKSIKPKQGHEVKDAVGKSPTRKIPIERPVTKGIQSSADTVAEKIVHSSFQGTISRAVKCDEKLQRASTTESKKNQDRINKVTAEISATTEAAIKEQFKQLESKLPHELSVNSTHTAPKQKPKSPTRKQQKPATQQKHNEQKQTLQRQQSPQKQKPPRSPTRKQEQKLQQKQTMKQQTPQKQMLKELSQPKQQIPQNLATNLSKLEKQKIEIKESVQQQEQISSPNEQRLNKTQKKEDLPLEKNKLNGMQENLQEVTGKSHQNRVELKKDENKHEDEQKLLYLKEMKDQEQKEECDQPMKQQDKQTIEQQNQQQKRWELEEAHMRQHKVKESNKEQDHKEEPSEQEESKEHPKQQQSEDGDDDNGRGCGIQGRTCPIYFGVKSYLHHFYDSTPIKNSHLYEEYIEVSIFNLKLLY